MCPCSNSTISNESSGEEGLFEGRASVQQSSEGKPPQVHVRWWEMRRSKQRGHEASHDRNLALLFSSYVFLSGLFRSFHG